MGRICVFSGSSNGRRSAYRAAANVEGYYDPLMAFLRHGFDEQFVRSGFERMLLVSESPAALLDAFASFEPPTQAKWMDRAPT